VLLLGLMAGIPACGTPPVRDDSPLPSVEAVLAEQAKLETLVARVSVKLEGFEQDGVLRGVLLSERPGKFRLWLGKSMTPSFFDLVVTDDAFRIWLPTEQKLISGPIDALLTSDKLEEKQKTMIRLLRVFIEPIDRATHVRDRTVQLNRGDARRTLQLGRYGPDTESLDVGEVAYRSYSVERGAPVPTEVELTSADLRLLFKVSGFSLNEPHTSKAFMLDAPAGAEVVLVEDGGQKTEDD
jgi:hypothetical protein